jgi:quercetin dioxygenase-like cupin family protein
MTHYEWYQSGKVFGIYYTFDRPGDGIPRHDHGTALAHNIVVLSGSVLFIGQVEVALRAGSVFDFDWTLPHSIKALEDNTRVLHLFLHGMPKDYETFPPSERKGKFDAKL